MGNSSDALELVKAILPLVGVVIGGGVTYTSSVRVKEHDLKLSNKQMTLNNILIPLGKELEKISRSETMDISESIKEIEKYISVDKRIYLEKKMRRALQGYVTTLGRYERSLSNGVNSIYADIKRCIESDISKNGNDYVEIRFAEDFKSRVRNVLLQEQSSVYVSMWEVKEILYYKNGEVMWDEIVPIKVEIYEIEEEIERGNIHEEAIRPEQWLAIDCHKQLEKICTDMRIDKSLGYRQLESDIMTQYQEVENQNAKLLDVLYKYIDKITLC